MDLVQAFSMGLFLFTVQMSYAYFFILDGIWVNERIWNHAYGRAYEAGDAISIFFVVLFSCFSLNNIIPHFNAIAEGKVAGKLVYDVIDR